MLTYLDIPTYLPTYLHTRMHAYTHTHIHIHIHMHIHIHIHIHMPIHIHIHIHIPYITLPYLTLPYITLHYITLRYVTLPYLTLHYIHAYTHTYSYSMILAWIQKAHPATAGVTLFFCHGNRAERYNPFYLGFTVTVVAGLSIVERTFAH